MKTRPEINPTNSTPEGPKLMIVRTIWFAKKKIDFRVPFDLEELWSPHLNGQCDDHEVFDGTHADTGIKPFQSTPPRPESLLCFRLAKMFRRAFIP